eukprot:SAG22_NODE_2825_length_2175_cov_2.095857_2_plen_142_part_00
MDTLKLEAARARLVFAVQAISLGCGAGASQRSTTAASPLGPAKNSKTKDLVAMVGWRLLYLEVEYVAARYPLAYVRQRKDAEAARAARKAANDEAVAAQMEAKARAARGWLGGGPVGWLAVLTALVAVFACAWSIIFINND